MPGCFQEERTVVIAEPVFPADSPARSSLSASAAVGNHAANLSSTPARAASSGRPLPLLVKPLLISFAPVDDITIEVLDFLEQFGSSY